MNLNTMKKRLRKLMLKVFGAKGFSKYILGVNESPAYAEYCKRVYGQNLCQLNMADMEQINKLLEVTSIQAGDRVLDLGCGAGRISEYIAQTTSARVTGVDYASAPIREAQRRAEKSSAELKYLKADMNRLDFQPQSFDVIISIDTLYFVDDLNKVIEKLKTFLSPKGRMGIFYTSESKPGQEGGPTTQDKTDLACALQAAGFEFSAWDFTESERKVWTKGIETAEALRDDFKKENRLWIYKTRLAESQKCLSNHEQGKVSRYLYWTKVA